MNDRLSERKSAVASFGPVVTDDRCIRTRGERLVTYQGELGRGVSALTANSAFDPDRMQYSTHENWFTATITLRPNLREFWICFTKFLHPSRSVSKFSWV